MLAPALVQSFFCMRSSVCKLKVEKVVKPPQKPVIRNSAVGDLRWSISQNPAATPMINEPSTLAVSVPKGKVSNRASPTANPCRPRLPSAPPRAMQSQVMRGMYTRARVLARVSFLSRRGEGLAKDDADGAGGYPVGGIVGVTPDPLTGGVNPAPERGIPHGVGGALAVVEPHHGVHVIIAKSTVHIGAGPYP